MKKQIKKSLSLFMAVLMLLSCWVWVAPQKAAAVTAGNYKWRVLCNSYNNTGGWNSESFEVRGKDKNGQGTETSLKSQSNWYVDFKGWRYNTWGLASGSGTSQTCDGFTTSQFPTKINYSFNISQAWGARNLQFEIYLQIWNNNTGKWVNIPTKGTQNSGSNVTAQSDNFKRVTSNDDNGYDSSGYNNGTVIHYEIKSAFSGKASASVTLTVDSGALPKADTVDFVTAPGNVTIPKTGNATTTFQTRLKDQFGVVVGSSSSGYTRNTPTLDYTTGCSVAYGTTTTSNDPGTITVNNNAKMVGTTNSKTVTLTTSYKFNNTTATGTKTFTLTDPKYTFYYDGNGGTVSPESKDEYYGSYITNFPTTGTRTGYDFKGMYSSAYTCNSKNWIEPPTSSHTKLSTSVQVNEDKTWYAAWHAKDITVYFEDGEGNRIGSAVTSKYENTLSNVLSNYSSVIASFGEPGYHKNPSETETGTYDYVFVDWAVYSALDFDGNDYTYALAGKAPNEAVLKGETVFRPVYNVVKNSYDVNFYGPNGAVIKTDSYSYKDVAATPAGPVVADSGTTDYTYEFKGWTKSNPGASKYYVVNAEGKKLGTNDYIPVETDFTVRRNTNYYPVFEKSYEVKFYDALYNVISSTKYAEGALITPPADQTKAADLIYTYSFLGWGEDNEETVTTNFTATKNVDYYPVFESTYIEYNVRVNDAYGINNRNYTLHYGDEVPVVQVHKPGDGYTYTFTGWSDDFDGFCKGSATYTAFYSKTPAIYAVKFVDRGTVVEEYEIAHGGTIPAIPSLSSTTYIDDNGTPDDKSDDVKYTFDSWQDGNSRKPNLARQITADTTYEAKYKAEQIKKVQYIASNAFEGVVLYEDYAFEGDAVPAYVGETPIKADDMYAENYVFTGWADEGGNEVTTMPAEDLDLYAQFDGDKIIYTVTFIDESGDVISSEEYGYGETVVVPATDKEADKSYTYTFKAWQPALPAEEGEPYICQGNATHMAVYKKTRITYTVTFLNDDGSVLATQTYINGARIIPPLDPTSTLPTEPGFTRPFVGWKRTDNDAMFHGDRIDGANITYKATYDDPVGADCTVKFVVEGNITEVQVPYETKLKDIEVYAVKGSIAAGHYVLDKWVDNENNVFGANDQIVQDIVLTAVFRLEDHTLETEILDAPTFTEIGHAYKYCSECGYAFAAEEIPVLADTVKPTGRLTIGKYTWQSVSAVDPANPVRIKLTDMFIVNTEDKAEVDNVFNPNGKGSAVAKIEMSPQPAQINAADISEAGWNLLMENNTQETMANYTRRIGETGWLNYSEGVTFIVYLKITDRNGNVSYINSDMLLYDDSKPVITIIHFQTNEADKACQGANIIIEDPNLESVVVKHNGNVIAPNVGLNYRVDEPGKYEVVAVDSVNNTSKTSFTLKAHDFFHKEKAATCIESGFSYDECYDCGVRKNEVTTEATGTHTWDNGVHHDGTCTENGYTEYTCKICDETKRVYDDPPTWGHRGYEIGRIPATCAKEGKIIYECTLCQMVYYKAIPIDENAHNWKLVEWVAPTIYEEGWAKIRCTNCGKTKVLTAEQVKEMGYPSISKVPSFKVLVSVTDLEGRAVPNARISVYEKNKLILQGYSDMDGRDTFLVEQGTHNLTFDVRAGDHDETVSTDYVVDKDSIIDIRMKFESRYESCTCTCHKSGFFPAIFRFYQKIVKLFTGKPNCCSDPSSKI